MAWRSTRIRGDPGGGAPRNFRGRTYTDEEPIEWEGKMSPSEAIASSLRIVTAPSSSQDASKSRRVNHLNALVKMWQKREAESDEGLRLHEVMLCLRIPLIHESTEVRAAALRTLRYLIKKSEDVQALTDLNVHYLITRCLDLELENKIERVQALKLARSAAFIAQGSHFPTALLRSIAAIAENGKKENDRLYRIALAILCELSVLNPDLFLEGGGVKALSYCLLDTSMPKIAEAIIAALLRLHNNPKTRSRASVNLGMVVAPFTEFRYIHQNNLNAIMLQQQQQYLSDLALEERQKRFRCAETAFLSTMRSWTGLCQLAQARPQGPSHLQALIDILYLKSNEVRLYLINLLYELLNLKSPKDATNFNDALKISDPSTFRETWKLAEGFVACEGLDILPHISKSRPNLVESHMSLMLHLLLKANLPDALITVIVDTQTETSLSISATVLLGELLHMANLLLPREVNIVSHCLPRLLEEVGSTDPLRSTRAQEAVAALQKLHGIKKRGPKACSLFLDQMLSYSGQFSGECFVSDRFSPNWTVFLKMNNSDEKVRQSIKLSSVNINYDANVWDWNLVTTVLKWPSESLKLLDDQEYRNFVRRIMDYFKPNKARFAQVELSNNQSRMLARACCYMLDFLVDNLTPEAERILDDFLRDIQTCLGALIKSESAHDCLFSPTRVASTSCQYYFLFIGRLSRSNQGRNALDRQNILGDMTELLNMRSDLYLKLVISCLDYSSMEWGSRSLLSKALKEGSETCRLYATRFLGVLIRSRAPNVGQWGIELLAGQLFDSSDIVPWIALELLDEACDDKMNLEAAVCALQNRKLDLANLGIRGELLKSRFVTSTHGIKLLTTQQFIQEEFVKWRESLNEAYVVLVEELINDGLTRHQRDDDLSYGRRTHQDHTIRDVFLPHHFYGQLAMTKTGLEALINEHTVHDMLQTLAESKEEGKSWMDIKKSIWAMANIAITHDGAKFVDREGGIGYLVDIAESSDVYSLRATAFYALSLVATTRHGCQVLASKGWCTLRYGRDEQWPVLEDWFLRLQVNIDHWDVKSEATTDSMDDFFWLGSAAIDGQILGSGINRDRSVSGEAAGNDGDSTDKISLARRSGSFHYTPTTSLEDDEVIPRSHSLSSRTRLSKLFKSFSDGKSKKTPPGGPGDSPVGSKSGSLTRKIRKSLFPKQQSSQTATSSQGDSSDTKRDGQDFVKIEDVVKEEKPATKEDTITTATGDNKVVDDDGSDKNTGTTAAAKSKAPIATPERSKSSSGEGLEEIKEIHDEDEDLANIVEPEIIITNANTTKPDIHSSSSTSGVSSGSSLHKSTTGYNVITSKLSPIPSSASITTGVADIANVNPDPHLVKILTEQHHLDDTATELAVAKPVKAQRSGQRAFSESEAFMSHHQHHHMFGSPASTMNHPGANHIMFGRQISANAYIVPGVSVTSMSSAGSFTENPGYLTLRSIHNRHRPTLVSHEGEGPHGAGGEIIDPDGHGGGLHHHVHPILKRSDSTNHSSGSGAAAGSSSIADRRPNFNLGLPPNANPGRRLTFPVKEEELTKTINDRYWGITLPGRIEVLLLHDLDDKVNEIDLVVDDKERHFSGSKKPLESFVHPGLSEATSPGGFEYHSDETCLNCYRFLRDISGAAKAAVCRHRSSSLTCTGALSVHESDYLDEMSGSKSTKGSPMNVRKQVMLASTTSGDQGSVNPATSSPKEAALSSGAGLVDAVKRRFEQRKEAMRVISSLNATIGADRTEEVLLKMKQQAPLVFKDLCFYSEVCALMSHFSFRLSSRRFVQELFMDVNFEVLAEEPRIILAKMRQNKSGSSGADDNDEN